MKEYKGKITKVAAVVAVFFIAALYLKVLRESALAYNSGEEAIGQNRLIDAVYHFSSSASWYAPLNPYVSKSLDRLWQIGRKAELNQDEELALAAYRAIRSALLGARSFYTPYPSALEQADRRIAFLMAREEAQTGKGSVTAAELRRSHYDLLGSRPQPNPVWAAVLVVGFFVWIGAVIYATLCGFDSSLNIAIRPMLRALLFFTAGMTMWICGMLLA